ncbi:hypothetical protein AOQ84DRAFT_11476 [Glonium stellatum]|uniref:Uncharacterized protein n=1 Tax=Glonium stellatum TaxID=574774 RepID=A0A8E2JU80_9PEZI|nr:hypothetical protein AOQ84DRAFT_11476 [Glonium stellatum]
MESFEILDVFSGGPGLPYGHYQILTASKTIKYLATIDQNPIIPDVRGEKLDFAAVPEGNWNVCHLVRKAGTRKFTMGSTELMTLDSIKKTWYPQMVDYLDLKDAHSDEDEDELQCQHQMRSGVFHTRFDVDKVIVNWEWDPQCVYGVNHETEIYSLIQGHNIGPRFLAHITENRNRVIGFMVERVPGRHATYSDLQACREVLSKLHNLGIAHGSLEPDIFLVTDDRVLLHSFAGSFQTDDKSALDAEMAALEGVLQAGLPQRKPVSQELSDEITAICERDDGIHPAVTDQAVEQGKITITQAEHKKLLLELWKNEGRWKPEIK